MPNLRATIHGLAQQFADGVLEAIRSASLDEIVGETVGGRGRQGRLPRENARGRASSSPPPNRLARRSGDDIAALADGIVALVKQHPKGLRAEQIRAQLGIAKNQWMRPLETALASKQLTKKGAKRATTYYAG